MKKNWLVLFLVICLPFIGCKDSAKIYPVEFVNRSALFASDKKPNPLMLVVEIDEDGKLSLNKIETGTISDMSILSEKIEAIFEDRKNTGIIEKEIVIDPQGKVESRNLEKLVNRLGEVKAKPIRVIKNNLY